MYLSTFCLLFLFRFWSSWKALQIRSNRWIERLWCVKETPAFKECINFDKREEKSKPHGYNGWQLHPHTVSSAHCTAYQPCSQMSSFCRLQQVYKKHWDQRQTQTQTQTHVHITLLMKTKLFIFAYYRAKYTCTYSE